MTIQGSILTAMMCFLLLLQCGRGEAMEHRSKEEALQDQQLRSLLKAQSSSEVSRVIEVAGRLKELRLECDVQLKGTRLPIACLETLQLEMSSGLIASTNAEKQSKWLNQLCSKRAKASKDRRELSRVEASKAASSECRTAASDRSKDLDYAAESESPSELFTGRLDSARQ